MKFSADLSLKCTRIRRIFYYKLFYSDFLTKNVSKVHRSPALCTSRKLGGWRGASGGVGHGGGASVCFGHIPDIPVVLIDINPHTKLQVAKMVETLKSTSYKNLNLV